MVDFVVPALGLLLVLGFVLVLSGVALLVLIGFVDFTTGSRHPALWAWVGSWISWWRAPATGLAGLAKGVANIVVLVAASIVALILLGEAWDALRCGRKRLNPRIAGTGLRRGFWRIAFVLWVGGSIGLAITKGERHLVRPFQNVCAVYSPVPPEACLSERAEQALREGPPELDESEMDRLLSSAPPDLALRLYESKEKRQHALWEARANEADPAKVLMRWRTHEYRSVFAALARAELIWALIVWIPFYAIVWIATGFRRA